MVEAAGVNVAMKTTVSAETIRAEQPDTLIVATGSRPFLPRYVPGIDEDIVTDYAAIIDGKVAAGENVVVVGGQMLGVGTAEYPAEQGADVTVVEATGALAADLEFMAQMLPQVRLQGSNQISVKLDTNVERIGADSVQLQLGGVLEELHGIDQIVFALKRAMDRDLINNISGGLIDELDIDCHTIGDCVWPREPYDVILEANQVGRAI